ncbi:MAG: hypothetical protein VX190_05645, partial [Bacteroidota bacterium]|nr:hypothetical protein [Bacteroidota bacterium]
MILTPSLLQRSGKAMSMVLVASTLAFSGCVTTQQYEALQTQLDEAESENASLRLARQDAQVSSRELEGQVARLTAENETLAALLVVPTGHPSLPMLSMSTSQPSHPVALAAAAEERAWS